MKCQKIINYDRETIFNKLLSSLYDDVKNKNIKKEDIKTGYQYKKTLKDYQGNIIDVKVKIEELTFPKFYHVSFVHKRGVNKIIYELIKKDENKTLVKLTEKFHSFSTQENYNYLLMNVIMYFNLKKQGSLKLKQLENALNLKENS